MKVSKNILAILIVSLFSLITGCKLNAEDKAQYKIEIKYVTEKDSDIYKKGGLQCKFTNLFPKTIDKFLLVFSLYDEDNVTIFWGTVYQVDGIVEPNQTVEFCLNLDEAVEEADRTIAGADFPYVSRISFSDGSEWQDPYGLKYSN